LNFGASLALGAWILGLFPPPHSTTFVEESVSAQLSLFSLVEAFSASNENGGREFLPGRRR
jgi:hypothetical protein